MPLKAPVSSRPSKTSQKLENHVMFLLIMPLLLLRIFRKPIAIIFQHFLLITPISHIILLIQPSLLIILLNYLLLLYETYIVFSLPLPNLLLYLKMLILLMFPLVPNIILTKLLINKRRLKPYIINFCMKSALYFKETTIKTLNAILTIMLTLLTLLMNSHLHQITEVIINAFALMLIQVNHFISFLGLFSIQSAACLLEI